MATAGSEPDAAGALVDPAAVIEHAGAAVAAGITPGSAEGQAVLHRLISPELGPAARGELADKTATFTDRRVERYWSLLGTLNGWEPVPPRVPAFEWLIEALRARP
jgi:hypothetical protein